MKKTKPVSSPSPVTRVGMSDGISDFTQVSVDARMWTPEVDAAVRALLEAASFDGRSSTLSTALEGYRNREESGIALRVNRVEALLAAARAAPKDSDEADRQLELAEATMQELRAFSFSRRAVHAAGAPTRMRKAGGRARSQRYDGLRDAACAKAAELCREPTIPPSLYCGFVHGEIVRAMKACVRREKEPSHVRINPPETAADLAIDKAARKAFEDSDIRSVSRTTIKRWLDAAGSFTTAANSRDTA